MLFAFFVRRRGVPLQQIKAFDVDEHGPIIGRAGGLQNADDFESFVLVPFTADAVRGIDFIAQLQPGIRGDDRTDDGLEISSRS